MMKSYAYFLHALLGIALALLLTTACDRTPTSLPLSPISECRPVQHIAGQSCIPLQPQRVITLDSITFEHALALGIQPIGSVLDQLDSHLLDRSSAIENVGTASEPNLEKILKLKPDLILGLDFHQNIYSQASRIAPVVLFEFQYSGQWKEIFQQFAEVLGQGEKAKQVIDRYYQRLSDFKAETRGVSPKISVVRVDPISLYPYFRDSFAGVILQDAGLSRPAAQNLSMTEARQRFNNPIQTAISHERLDFVDGDVIFVWIGENSAESMRNAQVHIDRLRTNPLWRQLPAVAHHQVHQVPSYWIGSGAIAANLVIDDLFKYLVKVS